MTNLPPADPGTAQQASPPPAPARKRAPARKKAAAPRAAAGGGGGKSGYLNYAQLIAVALHAGASENEAVRLAAIAMAESNGYAGAHNPHPPDDSYGLWQINMLGGMGPSRRAQLGLSSNDELFNPVTNARAALSILRSQGWGAWSTYSSGTYTQFMPRAERALPQAAGINVNHLNYQAAASTAHGGNGGGSGFNTVDAYLNHRDQVDADFGYLAAFLDDPEIGPLLRKAASRDWSYNHLQNALANTEWWKHHSDTSRQMLALQQTDPASYRQQHQQMVTTVRQTASSMGINLDSDRVGQLATTAMFSGWSETQLNRAVAHEFHYDPNAKYTGAAGSDVEKFKQLSGAYLVPISNQELQQWTRRSLTGAVTPDDYQNYLQDQAKTLFPWMSKAIDSGINPNQYLDPYRQAAASTLELDPSSVDFTNHKWRKLFETVDPKTGERAERGLANAMTLMRTDPTFGYDYTSGAKQEAAGLAQQLAQSFGFAA